MPKPGDFIVVHLVEKQAIGTRFEKWRNVWPLHITLAGWFAAADSSGIADALRRVANSERAFEAQLGDEAMFGHDHDIRVQIVTNQGPIKELHELLVTAIKAAAGAFENEHWFGENYRAHVTQHDNATVHKGDSIQVNDFHLVKLLPENICEIVQGFALREVL
jgi:2'-5' RNA ligase